jgi:chromosome segregation protein
MDLDSQSTALDALPLEELQTQHTYWNTNAAVIEQALSDARNRQIEKTARLKKVESNLLEIITRSSQLDLDIRTLNENLVVSSGEEAQITGMIEELGKIVDPYEELLSTLEKDHTGLLTTDTEARQLLRAAEQRYTQAKINLVHHQESFESLRRHIEDDFGLVSFDYTDSVSGPKPLPLDGMVEELPKVDVLSSENEDTIRQQKAQIRRMGAINPEAQSEYQEVKERFEFLSTQVADLIKAEGDIKEVITELDILMEREFRRTFDAVAQEFRQIFTRLFGGGSARLALTDPDNMTETGIDIEARLPGRREQGLSLLSGGERSLTAAALVFSLLRVSPTPFCILDEVDAMLDEANVSRFIDLLTELSEKTQFIVITHNRNTVQAASIIYGVTMGRDSVSQVISLRMDELGEEFGV